MRFIVDECTGPDVARWLRKLGHEVISVFEDARGADDKKVIETALERNCILITNDKDFSEKVYREGWSHHGIVLLRLEDERSTSKIAVLNSLLEGYHDRLADSYVVVTEKQVRFAKA